MQATSYMLLEEMRRAIESSIQVDLKTLAWFQAQGKDDEKKMAAALRIYSKAHKA